MVSDGINASLEDSLSAKHVVMTRLRARFYFLPANLPAISGAIGSDTVRHDFTVERLFPGNRSPEKFFHA